MGFFVPQQPVRGSIVDTFSGYSSLSIRAKLFLTIIPFLTVLILATGYAIKVVSGRYLVQAQERTTRVLTMGQANAVSQLFEQCRQDILLVSKEPNRLAAGRSFLTTQARIQPGLYREVAFISGSADTHILFVDTGSEIVRVAADQYDRIKNSPVMLPSRLHDMNAGTVHLVGLAETTYPPGALRSGGGPGLTLPVFRLVTPALDQTGQTIGFWVFSLDGRAVRDILSLYNSDKSPLAAFPRTPEKRFSFYFDTQGWILFQSESQDDKDRELSTNMARSGLPGDHGMPSYPRAFRPEASNEAYWRMVVDVRRGSTGVESGDASLEILPGTMLPNSLGFAPVYFQTQPGQEPEVVGGVAYLDRSRLPALADYRVYDVLFVIVLASVVLAAAIILFLGASITKPVRELTLAVQDLSQEGVTHRLELPDRDKESKTFREAINALIDTMLAQKEELRLKEASIQRTLRREPLPLDVRTSGGPDDEPVEGLIGASPPVRELKWFIRKAASVDPDVLIIGETGTGKEVTAQAIHRLSRRRDGPFITINCGALDENLLLDALFGHVKGAFSDARTDRKGAFLAAEGGTLLLDEIGNASTKVQQALLRALAARTIIPLGSDREVSFDARVIAATNVELKDLVNKSVFREDLYYRLRVLALRVPPLRDRKEDLPLLADAFLKESAKLMKKPPVTLSRGAWERIVVHDWPGNVRELKHCLMRAVAMAESEVIYLEDLRFDLQPPGPVQDDRDTDPDQGPAVVIHPPTAPDEPAVVDEPPPAREAHPAPPLPEGLNERQRKGLAYVQAFGIMSRAEYQRVVGEGVPQRTAQYDLRDLVERKVLHVQRKGPSTRYLLNDLREKPTS